MTAVITGAGVASAFGVGTRALLAGRAEGRDAVGPIRGFDARAFPTRVAAEVPLFGASLLAALPAHDPAWDRDGTLRDRKVVFALLAAAEAWRQAGCGRDDTSAALSIAIGLEQAFLDDFLPILRAREARLGRRTDGRAAARAVSLDRRSRAEHRARPPPGCADR